MKIGVPAENAEGETRVAVTPEIVKKLVAKGFQVSLESGAGEAAYFPDAGYTEAGAEVVDRATALAANIVVKVRKPTPDEIAALASGAVLISFLATLYPAWQAARMEPAEALRYE